MLYYRHTRDQVFACFDIYDEEFGDKSHLWIIFEMPFAGIRNLPLLFGVSLIALITK